MFAWWGSKVVRWRRWILAAGVVFALVGGLWGTRVFGVLANGGFDDKGSENQKAQALLDERIGNTNADVVVLFRNPGVTVDDPAFRQTVDAALRHFFGTAPTGRSAHITAGKRSNDSLESLQKTASYEPAGAHPDGLFNPPARGARGCAMFQEHPPDVRRGPDKVLHRFQRPVAPAANRLGRRRIGDWRRGSARGACAGW